MKKYKLLLLLVLSMLLMACNNAKEFSNLDNTENEINESIESKEELLLDLNIPNHISIEDIDVKDYRLSSESVSQSRQRLIATLPNQSLTILFSDHIVDDMKYLYTPNRNFYYLTGIDRENFILLIIKSNDGVEEYLFANEVEAVNQWTGKMLTTDLAREYSNIKDIKALDTFDYYLKQLLNKEEINQIYLDLQYREFDEVMGLSKDSNVKLSRSELFSNRLSLEYPELIINNISYEINKLRAVKSNEEILMVQNAIALTGEGIKSIMDHAKPGMMEYQLESYFNFRLDSMGVKEYAFPTIAASGENATILHYIDNDQMAMDGSLVLFDLGASFGYYSSDISRTIPINGQFTDRQEELYNIVLKTQLATIEAIKPGVTMKDLSKISRDIMANELMEIGVIKNYDEIYRVYPHGISHSLGLETHDPLNYSEPLEAGMIITVEPGLYLENEGIGIRIEDDILVVEDGYLNLSESIIKTVEDIEAYMNKK